MAEVKEKAVKLQVAAARQEESGNGFARLPRSALSALGVTEGDVIEIEGKRATAARVQAPYPEDEGLDVIRLDGLQRANAEVGSGDHVQVRKAQSKPAQRVVFAPAQREMRLQGPGQALKRNFFGRSLVAGDIVATTGQQQVRDMPPEVARMFNAPAFSLTQIRLTVVSTVPKGIVHIDENTEVELREQFEEARGSRGDVNYDDVGGMGDTIQQLREMVELPLRYPELFAQLNLGIFVDVDDPLGHGRDHGQAYLRERKGRSIEHPRDFGRHVADLLLTGGGNDIARHQRTPEEIALQRLTRPLQPHFALRGSKDHALRGLALRLADLDVIARADFGVGALQPVEPDHIEPFVFGIGGLDPRGGGAFAFDLDHIAFGYAQRRHRRTRQPRKAVAAFFLPRCGDLQFDCLFLDFGHAGCVPVLVSGRLSAGSQS